jgi:hypothetical protein
MQDVQTVWPITPLASQVTKVISLVAKDPNGNILSGSPYVAQIGANVIASADMSGNYNLPESTVAPLLPLTPGTWLASFTDPTQNYLNMMFSF